jgi:hypothetical protein
MWSYGEELGLGCSLWSRNRGSHFPWFDLFTCPQIVTLRCLGAARSLTLGRCQQFFFFSLMRILIVTIHHYIGPLQHETNQPYFNHPTHQSNFEDQRETILWSPSPRRTLFFFMVLSTARSSSNYPSCSICRVAMDLAAGLS